MDILDWTLCFKITLFIFFNLGSFLLRIHNTFLVLGFFGFFFVHDVSNSFSNDTLHYKWMALETNVAFPYLHQQRNLHDAVAYNPDIQ